MATECTNCFKEFDTDPTNIDGDRCRIFDDRDSNINCVSRTSLPNASNWFGRWVIYYNHMGGSTVVLLILDNLFDHLNPHRTEYWATYSW